VDVSVAIETIFSEKHMLMFVFYLVSLCKYGITY
jgi:hypothetical protein